MGTVSAFDVAKYILSDQASSITAMKLQKLCYYGQAWHLAWTRKPLFRDTIEAWAKGPVVKSLYDAHKGRYAVSIDSFGAGDPSRLSPAQQNIVDRVLQSYGPLSATQLSMLTHSEAPWVNARNTLPEGARSNAIIAPEVLQQSPSDSGSERPR
jgi:uncharacterized phage-associated protein